MSDATIAPGFCTVCGAVQERVPDARDEIIETLRGDVENVERELKKSLRRERELRADQHARLRNNPLFAKAEEVLLHWQAVCHPKAREPLSDDRLEGCLARLRGGYSVTDLKRSCDGYSLKPFIVNGRRHHEGPKDAWRADAEFIFRTAGNVDQGLRIADRADDLREVMAAGPPPATDQPGPSGDGGTVVGSPLLLAALKAARHGFFVFPCKPREKVPATINGFKAATQDVGRITAAWSRADFNIGVACGASGLLVLDVDGDEGFESLHRLLDEEGLDELEDTLSVKTPSGGSHFYFQAPPGSKLQNTQSVLGEFIDTRGVDGYVLMPPSVGAAGRSYEVDDTFPIAPLPDWLKTRLEHYEVKKTQSNGTGQDWVALINNPPKQGSRDSVMTSYVGHLYAVGMNQAEVMATARLLNAQAKPPLAEKQLNKIVASIARAEARRAA